VQRHGRQATTAIFKYPGHGPRFVGRINVDGDDQADRAAHRAVLVYQTQSDRFWQEQLGHDDFTCGQSGENFTVEGLPDDEVCAGDRNRIGSAMAEVPQPRDLLPRRPAAGRAADAGAAGLPPPPRLPPAGC
jgi:MOSC domain-containing protein YiiM